MAQRRRSARWVATVVTVVVGLLCAPVVATAANRYDIPIVSAQSGQCLDVSGGSTADGATLIQWPCHGRANQRWDFIDWISAAPWVVFVKNRNSGKCLDMVMGGEPVSQRGCWANSSTQKWDPIYRSSARGWHYYEFRNGNDLCLDVPGGSTAAGAVIQVWPCNGGTAQLWRIPA